MAGRLRLERFRRLINRMCSERPRPSYIVFPECSVPRDWAKGIAFKLAQQRISFIAGHTKLFISGETRTPMNADVFMTIEC
jgi:hypothetical protein